MTGVFPWILLTIRPWNDDSDAPNPRRKLYSLFGVKMVNIFLKASFPPKFSDKSSSDLDPLQGMVKQVFAYSFNVKYF